MSSSTIDWRLEKEASGSNDEDLDEVQEVGVKLCSSIERNDKHRQVLHSNRYRAKL
jgi:hypothetical protein